MAGAGHSVKRKQRERQLGWGGGGDRGGMARRRWEGEGIPPAGYACHLPLTREARRSGGFRVRG